MSRRWIAAALLLATVGVAGGCSRGGAAEVDIGGDPASVTALQGPGKLHRIELNADAASRIGLRTDTVRALPAGKGGARLAVDIAAVLYDQDGATWVYAVIAPLTFQRAPVTVSGMTGQLAILSAGPAVGTAVATQGAAELRGSEDGVPGE
jgi:hypothetical protein